MYEFNYQKPASVKAAVEALGADDEARVVAGGMTLLPTMKLRLAMPSALVDVSAIGDLAGISQEGNSIVIGAMTRHADVASSSVVQGAIPALAALAGNIGDAQVRNRGTIGGSIANNDPAADYPAALVGLNATVHTDRRTLSAEEFFTGMFETALAADELVTRVSFPIPSKAAYAKFPNPASRYVVVGVMVADTADGVRVAVTGAGDKVFRSPEMEAALAGTFAARSLDGINVSSSGFNEDLHATAEYRAHLVTVMAKRAVSAAGG